MSHGTADSLESEQLMLALVRGLGSAALTEGLKTHALLKWAAPTECATEECCVQNSGVVREVLTVLPTRVPRVSELRSAFLGMDDTLARQLSGARSKGAQDPCGACVCGHGNRAYIGPTWFKASLQNCSRVPLIHGSLHDACSDHCGCCMSTAGPLGHAAW